MSTNLKEDLLLRQTVGLMRYSVWQWQGREIGCGKTTLSLSLKSMWKTRNPFNGETPLISHRLPDSWIVCPILRSSWILATSFQPLSTT